MCTWLLYSLMFASDRFTVLHTAFITTASTRQQELISKKSLGVVLTFEEPTPAYASLRCRACIFSPHFVAHIFLSKQNTMPTCNSFRSVAATKRKAVGSNRLRQLFFRRIGQEMGIRARLGENLWREFMRDVNTSAKELWYPAFLTDRILCAGALDGPSDSSRRDRASTQ